VVIRNREIADKVVLRAVGITVASLLFVLGMALLISIGSNLNGEDPFTFLEMLFTCISAFATVGLDLGVTAELSRFGQGVLLVGHVCGTSRHPFAAQRNLGSRDAGANPHPTPESGWLPPRRPLCLSATQAQVPQRHEGVVALEPVTRQ
jgi:hypothetical protein